MILVLLKGTMFFLDFPIKTRPINVGNTCLHKYIFSWEYSMLQKNFLDAPINEFDDPFYKNSLDSSS